MILLLALAVTAALYWPGLPGPFIFDDAWNLEPVRLWLIGQGSFADMLFPQPSLVFSRPVAMASFALTSWAFGDSTFSFKLGNLIVHLACGVLGWLVLVRAMKRDDRLGPDAELLAALVAALWLLHPLHVSTVLYAVQRMAQLATLFTLAAVWVYLVARQQLIDGRNRQARLNLFVGFPVLLLLGVLSKQNAAVAPALCLVLELACFGAGTRPGRSLKVFFSLFLLLPMLAVAALLTFAPGKLLATYAEWDFTLWERLLTQPRVLLDYIGMLLFPRGPMMGLYTDDFVVSHGLFSPPSTLPALLALTGISIAAIALRKRAPGVFGGWFFFLVAHSIESGFLPLEMYYEHRNYLPSLGLLWAVFGLVALVPGFRTNVLSPRRLGLLAAGGVLLVLCAATLGRVLVWRDLGTIAQLGVQAHPDSMRARFDVASWAMKSGDHQTARDAFGHLATGGVPRNRQLGYLALLTVNCMRGVDEGNLGLLEHATAEKLPVVTTFEAQAFLLLSTATREKPCAGVPHRAVATALQRIVDAAATQPESATPKSFARYAVSEIHARDGQWDAAQVQSKLAWDGGRDKKVGAFLARVYLHNDHLQSARNLLVELDGMIKPYDKQGQAELSDIRRSLAEKSNPPASPPSP
ncbi:MAG TPA: hypothetical protein VNM48_04755 [Chloroflexota bacterium]|nr:hypothetical protein [Chloroflexota bacterium]